MPSTDFTRRRIHLRIRPPNSHISLSQSSYAVNGILTNTIQPIYRLTIYAWPDRRARSQKRQRRTSRPVAPRSAPAPRVRNQQAHRNTIQRTPRISRRLSLRSEEHTSELQSRFDLVCRL